MRVSINVTNYSWPDGPKAFGTELTRLVEAADRAGVDTVWVADHLLQADPTAAPHQTEMYEAYTVLGYLAARTARVRLGTMVSPVALRPPALLAKAATALDVLWPAPPTATSPTWSSTPAAASSPSRRSPPSAA